MTSFSYETSAPRPTLIGSTYAPLLRIFAALADAWRLHQTLRTMESLPFEARKDVGFPGAERMHDK